MFRRWILVIAAVAMMAPSASRAGSLQFFDSSAGIGVTRQLIGPVDGVILDIVYDARTAEGGGIFGFGSVEVRVTGDLQMTAVVGDAAGAQLSTGGPAPVFPTAFFLLTGGSAGGETCPGCSFADITISGTQGDVLLVAGGYSDFETFGLPEPRSVDPFTLATVSAAVPEPGAMLLLGMGLGGVAFLRRRSR